MKRINLLVLLSLPLLFLAQAFLGAKPLPALVNVHESIEGLPDVVKIQTVMKELGIKKTVLAVMPQDLLYFDEKEDKNLGLYKTNEEAVMKTVKVYPEEFDFFCTIDPEDPILVEKVDECLDKGALGVKMYNGYSYTHSISLASVELDAFYSRLTNLGGILMLPVNTSEYGQELDALLTLHPDLPVICPHFCLSSKNLDRLDELMDAHPNLYVDTSFGHITYVHDGLSSISQHEEAFQAFFDAHQDRILFGTSTVVTSTNDKNTEWVKGLYQDYLAILSEGEFESHLDKGVVYHGLDLPYPLLHKILLDNWNFLTS